MPASDTHLNASRIDLVRQLRRALLDLYDSPQLARSPLVDLLDLKRQADSGNALHRTLTEAIETLKPPDSTPPQASSWRTYRILLHRFIQQISQQEMAASLGFSIRQLQRHEQAALQALADTLRARYGAFERQAIASTAPAEVIPALAGTPAREFARLRETFTSQAISVADLVAAALRTAAPLLSAAGVRLEVRVPTDLPRVAVQTITMRQALVSLLAAARTVSSAAVEIAAAAQAGDVRLMLRAACEPAAIMLSEPKVPPSTPYDPFGEDENLAMANQLITLSGGSLLVPSLVAGEQFAATILLPVAQRTTVLAIDDNVDTLQLLQRYVEGSHYLLTTAQSPDLALALARQQPPHLILLDVMLPGTDGWELLGRLREHPATAGIPIIVSTILPHEPLALALGAAAFLRKPVSQATLLATLDALAAHDRPSGQS